MSRIARVIRPGTLQHVISRFVDREWFFASDGERRFYLTLFGKAMEHTDWKCFGYCLMSNHLHFAMLAGEQRLEAWTKRVHSPFAQALNRQKHRLGPIFADRPLTLEVPRHRELDVVAYIHNNPVKAGIVSVASRSKWSSHRAYIGRERPPRWLHVEEGLARFGCQDNPREFDKSVQLLVDSNYGIPDLKEVRAAARKAGQVELGTPRMSEPVEFPLVYARHSPRIPAVRAILEAVASAFHLPVEALHQRYARGLISAAKTIAVHVAGAVGVPIANIAAAINITRQRGSRIAMTALAADGLAVRESIVARLRMGEERDDPDQLEG